MITGTLIWPFVSCRDGHSCCTCSTIASPRDQWNYLYLPVSQVAIVQVSCAKPGGGDHRCHLWTGQGWVVSFLLSVREQKQPENHLLGEKMCVHYLVYINNCLDEAEGNKYNFLKKPVIFKCTFFVSATGTAGKLSGTAELCISLIQ